MVAIELPGDAAEGRHAEGKRWTCNDARRRCTCTREPRDCLDECDVVLERTDSGRSGLVRSNSYVDSGRVLSGRGRRPFVPHSEGTPRRLLRPWDRRSPARVRSHRRGTDKICRHSDCWHSTEPGDPYAGRRMDIARGQHGRGAIFRPLSRLGGRRTGTSGCHPRSPGAEVGPIIASAASSASAVVGCFNAVGGVSRLRFVCRWKTHQRSSSPLS
jgi:hypothetical protein